MADSSELRHLDGYHGTLAALVSQLTASAILRLFKVVGGQQTEHYGDSARGVQAGDTLGDTLTDVVEVRGLATDDAAEDDDGIVTIVERHLMRTVNQLERARNGLYVDVLRQRTVLFERGDAAIEQRTSDFGIPLRHDHAEYHIRRIGHSRKVVIAEIVE